MDGRDVWATYHETQVAPLVEKVAVDVDAVWFGEILGDQLLDGRQVRRLFVGAVADISKTGGRVLAGGSIMPIFTTHH